MNIHRAIAIMRKEFIHIGRDRRSLGMAIAMPILLIFLFAFDFQLRDSAVAPLPLCYAGHNVGIFQTVFIQIALQVRMKIAQFATVKNIVRTDFITLLVLRVFDNRHETKMQMRLAALVIMDDGLHDIFLAIAICQKIVCCAEKVIITLRV